MSYQKKMLDKSSEFSDVWRRVLWESPELDYTLKVPTNTIAKHKWIDEKRENIVSNLQSLSERYGLFFVYRSTCPYCHKYSPIIKNFGELYNIDIVAVTADNQSIEGWENNTIHDISALSKMGIEIKAVPATILYDNQEKKVMTVGFGILSRTDLENRIYALTSLEVNESF
jgi:conjugal transfer pilus assembly protein TraF